MKTQKFLQALVMASVGAFAIHAKASVYTVTVANQSNTIQGTALTPGQFNQKSFSSGDIVYFQAGKTYAANFCLNGTGNGVTLTSLGSGTPPVISGSAGNSSNHNLACGSAGSFYTQSAGLTLINDSNVTVKGLNFVGSGADNGILIWTLGKNISNITLEDLSVSNSQLSGIAVDTDVNGHTATNIAISYATVFNNGINSACSSYFFCDGIDLMGGTANALQNSTVQYVHASNNGNAGLYLNNANNVQVKYSYFYANGGLANGGAGFEASHSTDLLISENVSYDNLGVHTDGDGFDFDHSVQNSIMEFNYAFGNQGAGFLTFFVQEGGDVPNSGNVIRFNVAANNAQKNNYGEIDVDSYQPYGMNSTLVYNNSVYSSNGNSRGGIVVRCGEWVENTTTKTWYLLDYADCMDVEIDNNLVMTKGSTAIDLELLNNKNSVSFSNNAILGSISNSLPSSVSNPLNNALSLTASENLYLRGNFPSSSSPTFTNANDSLFQISSSSSPLVSRGANVGSPSGYSVLSANKVTQDIFCANISSTNIGASQASSSSCSYSYGNTGDPTTSAAPVTATKTISCGTTGDGAIHSCAFNLPSGAVLSAQGPYIDANPPTACTEGGTGHDYAFTYNPLEVWTNHSCEWNFSVTYTTN